MPMTSKKLVSQDDRNAADFGLDRIGDEAFVMCLVMHFMDLLRGRQKHLPKTELPDST